MSAYENYDSRSATYSGHRNPLGWKRQLAHFQQNSAVPLREQRLLDAGCGTGNYIVHYAQHFKVIHGGDFSNGMLDCAAENLENAEKSGESFIADVTFSQVDVTDMTDVPNSTYHALCNNQVLHHLPQEGGDFASIKKMIGEFYRVMAPGGRGVINYSQPQQIPVSMWWAELIPDAVERWLPRTVDIDTLTDILHGAGFTQVTAEPQLDEILYNHQLYFNPRSFLDIDNFRNCDSTFALCTDEELKRGVAKVQQLIDANQLDAWFEKKEADRKSRGQTTNVYFVKP
uniref:Methyltransferase type 11 domain-containing protein n=1 Tax=Spirobranchus lamarcki TaxID=2082999 RepID=D2WL83_SPILA|nr:hypothetical protein [Spirobranchus lamarcki]